MSVNLMLVTDAVWPPPVTVPEHVPFPLTLVETGPFDANVVSGSARTAEFESVWWSAFTQLFFSPGDSVTFAVTEQCRLLPGPAVNGGFGAADAGPAPAARPPTASASAAEAIPILRSISSPQVQVGPKANPGDPTLGYPRRNARKHGKYEDSAK
jgi:hypothetical protein